VSGKLPFRRWHKRLTLGAFGLIILAACGLDLTCYLDGRNGAVSFLWVIALSLAGLLHIGVLLVMVIIALARREWRRLTLGCFLGALLVFGLTGMIPPGALFKAGFRQRLEATITPDELKHIMARCSELVPVREKLPGPGKQSLWNEAEHGATWRSLTNTTAIGKLDNSLCVYHHESGVQILWGGALGHWGVNIAKDANAPTGDFGPGIRVLYGSH